MYLEIIKPGYQQPIDQVTYDQTLAFFETILKITHPFTPFIAEELWHLIKEREAEDCVIVAHWPEMDAVDDRILSDLAKAEEIVSNIRNLRKEKNISNKVLLEMKIKENEPFNREFDSVIEKLGNLSSVSYITEKAESAFSFVVKSNEYFIPFNEELDVDAEIEKIQEELNYTRGFLTGVEKKLSNERFVNNAPKQVIDNELKKQSDAKAKIKVLEEKLVSFA
jgi:valyl-tRNA synthetase